VFKYFLKNFFLILLWIALTLIIGCFVVLAIGAIIQHGWIAVPGLILLAVIAVAWKKAKADYEEDTELTRIVSKEFLRDAFYAYEDAIRDQCPAEEIKDKEQFFLTLLSMHKENFKKDDSIELYESRYNKLKAESSLSD
jgi:hypothetical protein